MPDLNNNKKSIKLPAYINTPYFLYQDNRLEKAATLIASFFYSLHTSGLKITASTDYLCQLAGIHKRQFYKIMNLLEECGYITRYGFTNRKKIQWIYTAQSSITVLELNSDAPKDTTAQELNTSALQDTKLVHSRTLNLCTPVHTDIKDNTKDYKKLTTGDQKPSSSSFFITETMDKKIIGEKLSRDERTSTEFLENVVDHIENHSDRKYSKIVRAQAALKLLIKLKEDNVIFYSAGKSHEEASSTQPKKETDEERMKRYQQENNSWKIKGGYM